MRRLSGASLTELSMSWTVMLLVLGVFGLLTALSSASLDVLLGESRYAMEGALHGVSATLFMVTTTIGLFQAYRLWTGTIQHSAQLKFGGMINTLLSVLTVVTGNRIYMYYRAAEGPRTYFLENLPEIHEVFFEFKEFIALFTVPLSVTAAVLFVVYGDQLLRSKTLRSLGALLLVLTFFYFMTAFGLGAAITKLRSI